MVKFKQYFKLCFSSFFFFTVFGVSHINSQEIFHVAFLADEGSPGHAFISLGISSEIKKMSITHGTWGLYPKREGEKIKMVVGEVPGKIRSDVFRNKDHYYVVRISKTEFDEMKKIIRSYNEKDIVYDLGKKDCLSFLIEIAEVIKTKIKIPKRKGFSNFPAKFVKEMITENQ